MFTQAGDTAPNNQGTFVIHLATRWESYATQAYRKLVNRYDVIELSPRDLSQQNGVEHAARDMEFVRAQLGDAQLLYLGNADGTRLGSRYGALYPERVARMVLLNAEHSTTAASQVEQLRLKDPARPDAGGCINRWVGDFLAYGRQPPRSTRCLDPDGWE